MSRMLTSAALAAYTLLAITPAGAAEMKITGTMDAAVTQQQIIPLGSADRVVVGSLHKGSTKSAGSPLDGASLVTTDTVVLDRGNGPQAGVITLGSDKGSITNEIRGSLKTVMVDGRPRVTTSGSWKMIGGTGIFAGGTGHGSYSVRFTSKTDWMGEYNGVLNLPKREASR